MNFTYAQYMRDWEGRGEIRRCIKFYQINRKKEKGVIQL